MSAPHLSSAFESHQHHGSCHQQPHPVSWLRLSMVLRLWLNDWVRTSVISTVFFLSFLSARGRASSQRGGKGHRPQHTHSTNNNNNKKPTKKKCFSVLEPPVLRTSAPHLRATTTAHVINITATDGSGWMDWTGGFRWMDCFVTCSRLEGETVFQRGG